MKCLLCNLSFSNQDELFEHYVQFHKIDKSNWFFKNLFNTKNLKILKKCLRCEEFIYDSKSKAEHDFLNHFSEGKEQPFENKPLNIRVLENKITIYSIEYSKHKDSYDFFDSEKCVNDFLLNCRNKLKKTEQNKTFKCSFTIQNQQKSAIPSAPPSLDTRYWSTSVYDSVFFNDFIFFSIKSDILNKVIQNGLSGSSWYFHKFLSLSLKVLEGEISFVN